MSTNVTRYGIVVGVDGSAPSDAAVRWAAHEAATRNVPLTLVHMFSAFIPTYPQMPLADGVGMWQQDDGKKVLAHAVRIAEDAVAPGRSVATATEVRQSPAVPTLIEMSADAEMVVVGSNGRIPSRKHA